MSILTDNAVVVNVAISEFLDHAFAWGKEDALEGNSLYTGLNYFPLGSLAWQSYEDGYKAGVALKAILTGEPEAVNWRGHGTDPLMFEMELEKLRSGQVKPLARMSEETLTAIEDEPIGDEHSRMPFLF